MTVTWSDARQAWRTEMIAAGDSTGTIKLRLYHLLCWERVCRHPGSATRESLIAWLGREGWAPEYRRSVRSSLVCFYRWLYRDDPMANPARDLPRVRVPIGEPRPASDEAIRTALMCASKRVWLMIMLGSIGGLRRDEISGVHASHFAGRHLRVVGKGGRVRSITLPQWIVDEVATYCSSGWLFPSPHRPGRHLTAAHVGVLISKTLPAGTTPHMLRHAAATHLHELGLSWFELRDFLGHASITTTQRYVKVYSKHQAEMIDQAARRFAPV